MIWKNEQTKKHRDILTIILLIRVRSSSTTGSLARARSACTQSTEKYVGYPMKTFDEILKFSIKTVQLMIFFIHLFETNNHFLFFCFINTLITLEYIDQSIEY